MRNQKLAAVAPPVTGGMPSWEYWVQGAVDVLGLVPILNIPAEIASALLSLRRRDYVGVGLSVAGLIPFEGEAAVALKLARHGKQFLHVVNTASGAPAEANLS